MVGSGGRSGAVHTLWMLKTTAASIAAMNAKSDSLMCANGLFMINGPEGPSWLLETGREVAGQLSKELAVTLGDKRLRGLATIFIEAMVCE